MTPEHGISGLDIRCGTACQVALRPIIQNGRSFCEAKEDSQILFRMQSNR